MTSNNSQSEQQDMLLSPTKRFFDHLFKSDASTLHLFQNKNMAEARVTMMKTIGTTIKLDDLSSFMPALLELAKNSKCGDITSSQFESVGKAALWTIQQGSIGDNTWNDKAMHTWLENFKSYSKIMNDAAEEIIEQHRTAKFKELVRSTWKLVEPIRLKAADIFYDRLNEIDKGASELFKNANMAIQKDKLTLTIGVAVGKLDEPDVLVPILQDLGRRHVAYGVTAAHYDSVGAALLYTLEKGLGDAWTAKAKEAWVWVYTLIADVMKKAAADVAPPAATTESKETPVTAEAKTERYKELVMSSWKLVEPIRLKAADIFYDRLFEIDKGASELFKNANMAIQKDKLTLTIGVAVGKLEDLEVLVPILQDLGRRHSGYGVTAEHYDSVGAALLYTLEKGLDSAWTSELKEAWTWVYTLIADVMKKAAADHAKESEERYKELVMSSWKLVEPIRLKAADIFYDRLFEIDKGASELFKNANMAIQKDKLTLTIGVAVGKLGDLDALIPILQDLGRRHSGYGVTPAHYDSVGAALLYTLEKGLGSAWTKELNEAWVWVYTLIANVMKKAAAEHVKQTEERYKELVMSSWKLVEPIRLKAADIFYDRLFEIDKGASELFKNANMAIQKDKLTLTIGVAVGKLGDVDALIPILQDLGRRHSGYGVTAAHYDSVGAALLYTLEKGLDSAWTNEMKEAWTWVYTLIADVMKKAAEENAAKQTKEPNTERFKELVISSWKLVEPIRLQAADIFYDRLFEVDKEASELFKNADLAIQKDKLTKTIGIAVDKLHDLDALVVILEDLGRRHTNYGVIAKHYDSVGSSLLWTLEKGLGNAWNEELKEAWTWVYGVMASVMKKAAAEVKPQNPEEALHAHYKELVQASWKKVNPIRLKAADIFYERLFEIDKSASELFKSANMTIQKDKLTLTIGVAVEKLDDMSVLVPILEDLGKRHVGYGVTAEHYDSVGAALLFTLEKGLAADWNDELKAAWTWVYGVMTTVMKKAAETVPSKQPEIFSDAQKKILRETWKAIEPISAAAATMFYERLFVLDPTTKLLFANSDMDEQANVLARALTHSLSILDDNKMLADYYKDLGRRHVKYGVVYSHIETGGSAILWVLPKFLGSRWTEEVKNTWIAYWSFISSEIIKGIRESNMFLRARIVLQSMEAMKGVKNQLFRYVVSDLVKQVPYLEMLDLDAFLNPETADSGTKLIAELWSLIELAVSSPGGEWESCRNAAMEWAIRAEAMGWHAEHMGSVKHAIMSTVEQALGMLHWNADLANAWEFITDLLVQAIVGKEGQLSADRADQYCHVLEDTWAKVQPVRDRLGAEFYFRLFRKSPTVAKMFRGTDMSTQSSRFTKMIGVLIRCLNNSEKTAEILRELGHAHAHYGVRPEMYDLVIQPFLESMELCLGFVGWTREVRCAWNWAMDFIHTHLGAGSVTHVAPSAEVAKIVHELTAELHPNTRPAMKTPSPEHIIARAAPSSDTPAPVLTPPTSIPIPISFAKPSNTSVDAVAAAIHSLSPMPKSVSVKSAPIFPTMSASDIAQVQGTWRASRASGIKLMDIFYARLLDTDATSRPLFVGHDMNMRSQTLFHSLDSAIENLTNLKVVIPELQSVGRRHAKFYHVTSSHFVTGGKAFMWTLANAFGAKWTSSLALAWARFWDLVVTAMEPTYPTLPTYLTPIQLAAEYTQADSTKPGAPVTNQKGVLSPSPQNPVPLCLVASEQVDEGIRAYHFRSEFPIAYVAGQYAKLQVRVNDKVISRFFTITSVHSAHQESTRDISFIIKSYPTGTVTPYMQNQLKIGDKVHLASIAGAFTFPTEKGKHYKLLFVSGGIGITPMYAMLRGLADLARSHRLPEGSTYDVVLVHSNHNTVIPCEVELRDLAKEFPFSELETTRFSVTNLYTVTWPRDGEKLLHRRGRVDSEMLKKVFSDKGWLATTKDLFAYSCGPPEFMKGVKAILTNELGVPRNSVKFEFFDL